MASTVTTTTTTTVTQRRDGSTSTTTRTVVASRGTAAAPGGDVSGWIIADMDGTLVPTPGSDADGTYIAQGLDDSPVGPPLLRWLGVGGNLLIITSDDGNWPIRKV